MAPYYSNDYLGVGPLFISNTQNILKIVFFFLIQISPLLFFGPRQKLEKGVIRALSNENPVKPVALNSMQQLTKKIKPSQSQITYL